MGDNLRKLRLSFGLSREKLCAELQRRGTTSEGALMKNMKWENRTFASAY